MKANKNNVNGNTAMMEALEGRELYSTTMLPAIQCPSDPAPTSSRIVVVGPTTTAPPASPNVVISIIAVLIGL